MTRLVAGEFRKLFSTRLWLWLAGAAAALTALFTSLAIAFNDSADNATPPLTTPDGQATLLAIGHGAAGPLVAVLGAIGLTGEFRHRTATTTFLHTPHRGRVVVAKLVAYAVVGAGYALICLTVITAIALPWLAAKGIDITLPASRVAATAAGVTVAVACYAVLGVGLGALVRDQAATVTGLLVYLFVVEPVVTRIPAFEGWTGYLPNPAANALTGIINGQHLLQPWQGGLVLLAYALTLATAGTWLALRRDIT